VSKSTTVLIALVGLLLLTWITLVLRSDAIEADLVQRVEQALAAYSVTGLGVEARGRDLYLSGEIPHEQARDPVRDIARSVWGVRHVDVSALMQRVLPLEHDDRLEPGLDKGKIVSLAGDSSNPMDRETCQRTLARLAAVSRIYFGAGTASPMPRSYPLLNDLATVVHQCPGTQIVIGGHTDSDSEHGTGSGLGLARAAAVGRFFEEAGIRADRIQVVAYGGSQPPAGNEMATGRAANRRISLDLLPGQ
jgi:outer membrane protein OmpA-like peptidoglycan-associated protein